MPPRRRPNFTQQDIESQLQSIHLLDSSSVTENLEALGPIIKTIHESKQQEAFLRTVSGLIEAKENEIEKICGDNYQDFVSSVSTLLTVRSYTHNLKERITSLDDSVSSVGHSLAGKKKELLQSQKTAANLDEAIDTLQGCLRVLDLVNRVGDMIKEGRYWSALRSLEEIQSLSPTNLSTAPLFTHLLSSLPSLRSQIQDAVTASTKSWLLEIRNISGRVGNLAVEAMKTRNRRWRSRKEKESVLKSSKVGSAVEQVMNEKTEYNTLDNDQVKVDFRPLYQCIHIHSALGVLPTLQMSYQADRKAQASLLLSARGTTPLPTLLSTLTAELLGFFIIEREVLKTTRGFRSQREVDELWEEILGRVLELVRKEVKEEKDADVILSVKDILTGFVQCLEAYEYDTMQLQSLIRSLFETYSILLEKKYATDFDKSVLEDDHLCMQVAQSAERENVLSVCWMRPGVANDLFREPLPLTFPFSQTFYQCCTYIREFVEKFYQSVDGVYHQQRDIDELLQKSLDKLLTQHVSDNISKRLDATSNLSQVAQIITNLEHFEIACSELQEQLMKLRATQRSSQIRLQSLTSFHSVLPKATTRLSTIIKSKLDDFFELSEYDWTPPAAESGPSMYLYELVNWLTTVVDSLAVEEKYRDTAYKAALEHVSACFMDFLFGRDITSINENGIINLLIDADFLESEFRRLGKAELTAVFSELRLTTSIAMNNAVNDFLQPSIRKSTFARVNSRRLSILLQKLAKYGQSSKIPGEREKGDQRKHEADAVARVP